MKIPADRMLVTFPRLRRKTENVGDDAVQIFNPMMSQGVVLTDGALEILRFFEGGASIDDLVEASDLDQQRASEMLEPLVDSYILVPSDDLEWLLHGVSTRAQRPAGIAARASELDGLDQTPEFLVFGVSLDLTGTYGARHGPTAVRSVLPKLSLKSDDGKERVLLDFENERCFSALPAIVDVGNISYHPGESLETVGRRIEFVFREARARGAVPLMLGGDHAWTHFTLAEMVRAGKDFGIIHFDAHHDMYPDVHGRLNHANPFLETLKSSELKVILQLGLRTLQLPDDRTTLVEEPRLHYVPARRLRTMEPEAVFSSLPRDIPYYLSFDVDCMDVDETGCPVIGGLSYYDGLDLFEFIGKTFDIVAADFMEVAGDDLPHNRGAEATGRYLFELLVAKQKARPLKDYVGTLETERPF